MNRETLLADLKKQVTALEADLLERAGESPFKEKLEEEYQAAKVAERTAATYGSWLDGQVTQAAVAWVLGTVFLRFCEDNRLIEYPYLAASGEDRREIPVDRQHEFYGANPGRDTDRDWILAGFEDMSKASAVAAGLFDEAHNPMWRITPSHHAAKELVRFWRLRGEDGDLVHDFTDPEWNTRFLGDLYQDLSEFAKKTYALLQTPDFVEEFILDLTLTPAIDEFGLEPDYPLPKVRANMPKGLRIIDPTCGSGHFLLGAFDRLLNAWRDRAPGAEPWELIRKVLYGIHGVDKNPFAVAIARFRLLLAAMKAADAKTMEEAPDFQLNIAVGDSLLHGRGAPQVQETLLSANEPHTYVTEDIYEQRFKDVDLLGLGSYHVVVGNPPYITVKDKRENENYRKAYKDVCNGPYGLSIPFAVRFFELGIRNAHERAGSGHIGQITSNSFMKKTPGKELVESYFNLRVDLTNIIDTSGAYIPGHGIPTVILIGRRSLPRDHSIRVVRSIQGEPIQLDGPPKGLVWAAIVDQVGYPGSESEWVTSADLGRQIFASHPWILGAGGADVVLEDLESSPAKIEELVDSIGRTTVVGDDSAWILPSLSAARRCGQSDFVKPLVTGGAVRDYTIDNYNFALSPYSNVEQSKFLEDDHPLVSRTLWVSRTILRNRTIFGKTLEMRGTPWYAHLENYPARLKNPLSIAFAYVATHNHFVLDRGGKLFDQKAPVVKLPESATEDDYLSLLAILNSSTACFWLKQVSHNKGSTVDSRGARQTAIPWEDFYEFTSTKLRELPLPSVLPLELGRYLESLAQELAATEPSQTAASAVPTRLILENARASNDSIRSQMIAVQEELDWEVYGHYGLLDKAECAALKSNLNALPPIKLGERAFEIVLARRMVAGEATPEWFARHRSAPTIDIPAHWPSAYREVVQRRIDCIESRKDIALIERPECKRRWATKPWEDREKAALQDWLLNACERRELWFVPDHDGVEQPRTLTVNQLADKLRSDADFVSVAELYAGADVDLAKVVGDIFESEHVPYLAALRYKDSGLRKRADWEETWEKQREEDRTGKRLDIAVPPKYGSGDFLKPSYWKQRGKLDVPKERFISYPLASPENDSSLLLGWAGWDHRQAAHALTMLIHNRSEDGWGREELTPLLAGLAEQLPWVKQWHGEIDHELGMSPADMYAEFLRDQRERFNLTETDLAAWRPPAKTRRRSAKKQTENPE